TVMVVGGAVVLSLTLTALGELARIEPKPEPNVPSMVRVLVIVTAPKPPGSRQSISPPAAVFEIAPAKVLQGAVRLQGLTSSPTPDTHVRVACAWASVLQAKQTTNTASVLNNNFILVIIVSFNPKLMS